MFPREDEDSLKHIFWFVKMQKDTFQHHFLHLDHIRPGPDPKPQDSDFSNLV